MSNNWGFLIGAWIGIALARVRYLVEGCITALALSILLFFGILWAIWRGQL